MIYREAEIAALLKDAGFSNAEVTQSLFRNIKATAQRLWQLTRRLPKLLPLLRLSLVAYKRACDHDPLSAGFLVPAIGWVREAGEERAYQSTRNPSSRDRDGGSTHWESSRLSVDS